MYVDDEADLREIVALALGLDPEIEVACCNSGSQAIEKIALRKPDLLLLDVMMPGLDGPATLLELRARPGCEDIPVAFMTARTQTSEIQHYVQMGAVDVITKPFDPMLLAAQVKEIATRSAQ